MTSMRDVAERAGVSVATVSNYINGSKALRPVTREKVRNAVEALNFHPNATARSLKQNASKEIGVILPSISDPYYSEVFKGIENIFHSDGTIISLAFSHEIRDNERNIISSFLEKRVSGIIAVTCQPNEVDYFVKNIISASLPAVFIDRLIPYLDFNYVSVNNYSSILKLTRKLLRLGYRDIAMITGPEEYSSDSDCTLAYREAYKEAGLDADGKLICSVLPFKEIAFDSTLKLFMANRIDAVITSSRLLLDGVLEALHVLHLKPEKDIPVISLGQDVWNEHTSCSDVFLTKRPAIDVGEQAALLLRQNIASLSDFESKVVCLEDNLNFDFLDIPEPSFHYPPVFSGKNKLHILLEEGQRISSTVKSFVRDFEIRENCEVIIKTRPMERLLDAIYSCSRPGNDSCDIFMYDIPWLPTLASEEVLADITDYIAHDWSPETVISSNLISIYGEYNKKLYGIPFLYAPPILFYRKDLFEDSAIDSAYYARYHMHLRPPITWKEYNSIAEFFNLVKSEDGKWEHGVCLYGQSLEHLIPNFLPRLSSFGGTIYDSELKITVNSAACRKALESLKVTASLSSIPFHSSTLVSATEEFYAGKTALLFGHSSYAIEYNKDAKSAVSGKVGYAPLPGKAPHISGWGLGISTRSENRDLALRFFSWLSRTDISNYMTILNGQSLLYGSRPNSELQKVYPWLSLEIDSFRHIRQRSGAYLPGRKVIPRTLIEKCLYRNICDFLNEKTDINTAPKIMEEELKAMFAGYGYR